MTPVTNYALLYSTLLCKNNARAPGGHKTYIPTKLGGGGQNRSYSTIDSTQSAPPLPSVPNDLHIQIMC